jgi:hypothetical protein
MENLSGKKKKKDILGQKAFSLKGRRALAEVREDFCCRDFLPQVLGKRVLTMIGGILFPLTSYEVRNMFATHPILFQSDLNIAMVVDAFC